MAEGRLGEHCQTTPVYLHSSLQPLHDLFPHGGLPLSPIQVAGRPPPPRAAHLHWVLLELAVFTLTEEVMFYYMHQGAARV
ncbi:hypothetical protein MC885_020610 [Smutsia gigantea]|nr:hypothetical protein MC885_020610 [Smutsia gigantea]